MAPPVDFKLTRPTAGFLHPTVFLKKIEFADDNERQYVKQLAKRTLSDKNRIYLLTNEVDTVFGFVALSVSTIQDVPCIVINYLFCSLPYRNQTFTELNGKISVHLIERAIQIAREVNTHVPIHYLALQPAHEKLEAMYAELDFKSLHHKDWMVLKI